jgi:DNA end-binding protein Ku
MAKALWTGSISFGLVNIPIRLYPATSSHQLEFHQLDSKTRKRVRYRRVIEGTNEEVPYKQIVDGYEVSKGKIVILTDEEMAAAEPKKSRTLDLEDFVPLDSIDPIAWNHTYYVGPDQGAGAQKAYAVLREAMKQTKRVGVGRLVMRSKQYLATLRPFGKGMALETMFFDDEIRELSSVPGAETQVAVSPREVDMARKLVEALSGDWHHAKYKDTHRDQLVSLIKQKAKGKVIEAEAAADTGGGKVIDLMEALKQSLGKGNQPPSEKAGARPVRGADRRGRTTASSSPAGGRSKRTASHRRKTRAA